MWRRIIVSVRGWVVPDPGTRHEIVPTFLARLVNADLALGAVGQGGRSRLRELSFVDAARGMWHVGARQVGF